MLFKSLPFDESLMLLIMTMQTQWLRVVIVQPFVPSFWCLYRDDMINLRSNSSTLNASISIILQSFKTKHLPCFGIIEAYILRISAFVISSIDIFHRGFLALFSFGLYDWSTHIAIRWTIRNELSTSLTFSNKYINHLIFDKIKTTTKSLFFVSLLISF